MMFWYGGGWAWWQAILMWFGMIAFWAAVAWAVYLLLTGVRRLERPERPGLPPSPAPPGPPAGGGPRRILDERLARGEIEPEEYRRLRDLLEEHPAPAGTGTER